MTRAVRRRRRCRRQETRRHGTVAYGYAGYSWVQLESNVSVQHGRPACTKGRGCSGALRILHRVVTASREPAPDDAHRNAAGHGHAKKVRGDARPGRSGNTACNATRAKRSIDPVPVSFCVGLFLLPISPIYLYTTKTFVNIYINKRTYKY